MENVLNNVSKKLSDIIKNEPFLKVGKENNIPINQMAKDLIKGFIELLFPQYFYEENISGIQYNTFATLQLNNIYKKLRYAIKCAYEFNNENNNIHIDYDDVTSKVIEQFPEIFDLILLDAKAGFNGDPAVSCIDEIILCYPGFFAIFVYRFAHIIYELNIPLLPRLMTEYAHSKAGIDINPGAKIGKSFFIDHGTGVVIGETTIIGDNVRIYQGVTLGALSLSDPRSLCGKKRHPTIGNNVIIYANATILGGNTVIGDYVQVNGNAFITHSIEKEKNNDSK